MEKARRTTIADHPSASSQFRGHQRESDRRSKAALDLSVTGRHIGPASASFSAEPRHAVSWEDEQQRPASSPEPVHGSTSRNEWAGMPRRHAQSHGVLSSRRMAAVQHHEARCSLLCRALCAPWQEPRSLLTQWQHPMDLLACRKLTLMELLCFAAAGPALRLEHSVDLGHASRMTHTRAAHSLAPAITDGSPVKVLHP